mmetsp:Transcript_14703/g.18538  ORF Transcript_14703/g.18538 Transcript_14703/m.18538 type:complete len:81 (-) Transcript_14703:175-417(-)
MFDNEDSCFSSLDGVCCGKTLESYPNHSPNSVWLPDFEAHARLFMKAIYSNNNKSNSLKLPRNNAREHHSLTVLAVDTRL